MNIRPVFLPLGFLLAALLPTTGHAQNVDPEPQSAREAVEAVRALYFQRNRETAYQKGQQWLEHFGKAPELHAWTVLNAAKTDHHEYALAEAEAMTQAQPESPWSWFALAHTLSIRSLRDDETEQHERALEASRKALALAPGHDDMLWTRAATLYRAERREEAIDFVETHRGDAENPAPMLVLKGLAQHALARERGDRSSEAALETFAEAREADPANVNAHYLPGVYLSFQNHSAEAYPLLKRAAELAPNASSIHSRYWRAVMGRTEVSPEEKRAEVTAGIEALLERRGASPEVLSDAARQYGEMDLPEKQRRLEERILQEAPESEKAEWVLVNRYRRFREELGEEGMKDPEKRAEYRRMLRDFIDYPHHPYEDGTLLGDAYRSLFYLARNDSLSTFTDEELLEVVNGLVEYEDLNPDVTFGESAKLLAERTDSYARAEEIARQGIDAAAEKIIEQKERGVYDTEKEFQRGLNWYTGIMHDALGWVYFQQGRMDDAEESLLRSYRLYDQNEENLHHLGQLYEAQGKLGKAEVFYTEGAAVQGMGDNPNDAALEALYRKRHGDLEGFEAYRAKLNEQASAERKKEVLATRLDSARALAAFEMERLSGSSAASASLRGNVAVINVWGTWCGPCVQEMPDLQKLHEKYGDDPGVTVLTINNDDNPDDVRAWMQEKDFDFPVLLDSGYLSANDVHSFPTTWFVNPDGQIAFVKVGYTEDLVQEFSWRVEALREGANL